MATASVERNIDASPQQLWEMVSDITRMGEWSPETTGCAWVGGASGPDIGSKFKGENENGRFSWNTTCVVTECEPGERFVFESRAPLGMRIARWEYRFEPAGEGCHAVECWTDLRNRLIKAVSPRISGVADRQAHNTESMRATLERLAAAAEA